MPRRCSFGCARSDITMHSFPNPDKFPDRFNIWVELVGGKLEKASDYEFYKKKKVCDIHFTDDHRNRFRRLNILAIPSIHLREFADDSVVPKIMKKPSPREPETVNLPSSSALKISYSAEPVVPMTIEPALDVSKAIEVQSVLPPATELSNSGQLQYVTSASAILTEHNYSIGSKSTKVAAHRKPGYRHQNLKPFQSQIKYLQSKLCRLRKGQQYLKERLATVEKMTRDLKFQQVIKNMTKPAQLFIHMQLQAYKKPKGRRFAVEDKILSLSLYKRSPKCYALLSKYFSLPSPKAMKRLISQIKISPGINPILFEKIRKSIAKKDVNERLCSLIFDEMSISPQIFYNANKDKLEGFATNQNQKFADHALVFMVKGIKQNFKQPVAYYFTNGLNKLELKSLIETVTKYILKSGLIIINSVCDQSAVNVGAITELVSETKNRYLHKKEWHHDFFIINGQKIIPIYDAPHLIKGIRNNLLNKDMLYSINGEEKIVKWEYFEKIYAADKSYGELRLLDKITEEHINRDKINKMRVKLATQIFSHSVAVVAEHLTARGDLPKECRQLVDITLLLDNIFDSLNVSNLQIPNGKIYKGPIKRGSPHHQLWVTAKEILKTVKFVKKQNVAGKIRLSETVIPSTKNLIKTIEGMEAIWKVLSRKYKFDCLLSRNLNQDPVENFFGNIRSYGARNTAPNTVSFEGAYKSLLLNNFNTPLSKRTNCEEDSNEYLQNLKFFLTESVKITSDVSENDDISFNNDFIKNSNKNIDAGQRNYVCGWVLTKFLRKIKVCNICRQNLIENKKENPNNSFIKIKEYKKGKKWLCYPNPELENCFHTLQNIAHTILKNNTPKRGLVRHILSEANNFINYPIVCHTHKDLFVKYFIKTTIYTIIHSWCRSINRILSGKLNYQGDDPTKLAAQLYYNKRKHYKNKK